MWHAVGDATRLGVKQDTLLAVQLADHYEFVPPMRLQFQTPGPRSDQSIDGIKISLQVVELAPYRGFYLAAVWLLLLGYAEEVGTCPTRSYRGRCLPRSERWSQRSSMIRSVDSLASLSNFRSVG